MLPLKDVFVTWLKQYLNLFLHLFLPVWHLVYFCTDALFVSKFALLDKCEIRNPDSVLQKFDFVSIIHWNELKVGEFLSFYQKHVRTFCERPNMNGKEIKGNKEAGIACPTCSTFLALFKKFWTEACVSVWTEVNYETYGHEVNGSWRQDLANGGR